MSCPRAPHPCLRPAGDGHGEAEQASFCVQPCRPRSPLSVLTLHQVSSPCTKMPPMQAVEGGGWPGWDVASSGLLFCASGTLHHVSASPPPSRGRRVVLSDLENSTERLWNHQPRNCLVEVFLIFSFLFTLLTVLDAGCTTGTGPGTREPGRNVGRLWP